MRGRVEAKTDPRRMILIRSAQPYLEGLRAVEWGILLVAEVPEHRASGSVDCVDDAAQRVLGRLGAGLGAKGDQLDERDFLSQVLELVRGQAVV